MMRFLILYLALLVQSCWCNVEKTVFIAPEALEIPTLHPTLDNLQLISLTPTKTTVRKALERAFPSKGAVRGLESWYLLENLTEGQRFEVRICWAAIAPTSFDLQTYELSEVFQTPELISSLNDYSMSRQPTDELEAVTKQVGTTRSAQSVLFLRIQAAADYYTTNKALMEDVPPVLVDIILDPFILNVFPQSLVPTAAYILIIAIASFFIARGISNWLSEIAKVDMTKKNR